MRKYNIRVPSIVCVVCVGKATLRKKSRSSTVLMGIIGVLGRCNGVCSVARALAVARWGCAVYCCVVRSRFSTSKTKKKATCENLGGGVGLSSGTRKTPGNTRNERSKKTTWSHRINCCCSRYVPEARCGRDDPLRRAKLRLIYSKTNTRDAKLQCNRLW